MSEKQKYIGVTIGPIFDTINLSSSPASLWAGSYLFSFTAKSVCEQIVKSGVPEGNIVAPYFSASAPLLNMNDGVGLFHDRVIFKADDFEIADFSKIKDAVIHAVAETFKIDEDYLKEYLMISAAVFEAENPILDSGKILDCLELSKTFVKRENKLNPIGAFDNEKIKSLDIVKSFGERWQLWGTHNCVKSLPDIASAGVADGMKKRHYYAILRSDGDNMSKIIQSLDTPEKVRDFSKTCLEYCSDAAKKVRDYGGITIYSGGDDLLAILPCENKSGETVFDFAQKLTDTFNKHFDIYNKETSLTVGIFMCYHKFPLYEALVTSANLLFGVAKNRKNCIAVQLQKHAGQSAGVLISNDEVKRFLEFEKVVTENKDQDVLLSALHKISLFEASFKVADKNSKAIYNLFENTFDADAHKGNSFINGKLDNFYNELCNRSGIFALDEYGFNQDTTKTIGCVLRMLKFFVEKGDPENEKH